jgi:NAD(P)-dependent dehydrogenase (short-subunit alcohol dehydrogenase family)
MDRPPRRVLVTGAHALAAELASGLASRGDRVVRLASVSGGVPCSFAAEGEVALAVAAAREAMDGIDQVVHAWVAPDLLTARSLVDVGPDRWAAGCERSLDAAWWLSRAVSGPLWESPRGSAVFVVPTVGLGGAAGFAMLAAVGEGVRALAKACARQWALRGVTVHTVATAPHHWLAADDAAQVSGAQSLAPPALGGPGDTAADLAPLIAALAGEDLHFLTAATLVADGGTWTAL